MAKRGLCIILAILTLFALAVPVFAAEAVAEGPGAPAKTSGSQLEAPEVTIAQVGDGIQVTWNGVEGAPRYAVYYKENGGSWKKIGTTTATTYTRKAANLKVGSTYQFTVRCCENDKKTMLSPYVASNSLKYQLEAPEVTIAQVSSGIQVTWNKVSGAPRYIVYYKENGGGWKKIGTTTATTYTRKASALKKGAVYQFTVRCCKDDKKTALSDYIASNSLEYGMGSSAGGGQLAAPTVTIAQVSDGIRVTWNKVSGAPRYAVYYKENGGPWKKIGTTTATSYTRKASALINGVTYQFTVRCCKNDKKTMLSGYTASNSLDYLVTGPAPTPLPEPAVTPAPQPAPTVTPAAGDSSGLPQEDPNGTSYVLNTNTMKFHLPGCRYVKSILSYNREDVKALRDAVIAAGYSPCAVCCP